MISGTDMTTTGFRSAKAASSTLGVGIFSTKVTWQPAKNGARKSKAQPKAWASGRNETMLSPGCSVTWSRKKRTFTISARCVSMTPLEKPVVPEV